MSIAETQATDQFFGLGLYTPTEAARYARVSSQKLSRWIFGTSSARPVIDPELGRSDDKLVTFLDFAQSLSIYEIRLTVGIALQKIRGAYERAQNEHGVRFPLAIKHGMFLFGDLAQPENCEIGVYLPQKGDADEREEFIERASVQLTGKKRGNQLINEVVQPFSKNLIYSESGTAAKYIAFLESGFSIVMDPEVRFGKPYIEHVGYEAETLADAVEIEGGVARAAKLYGVPREAVDAAIKYREFLSQLPQRQPPTPIAA